MVNKIMHAHVHVRMQRIYTQLLFQCQRNHTCRHWQDIHKHTYTYKHICTIMQLHPKFGLAVSSITSCLLTSMLFVVTQIFETSTHVTLAACSLALCSLINSHKRIPKSADTILQPPRLYSACAQSLPLYYVSAI